MSAPTDVNGNEPINTELAITEPKPATTTTENTNTAAVTTETTTTSSTATTPTSNKPVQKTQKKKDNKNDPARFEGLGINFNAKLIGVDSVPDARGDKMCQEKMQQLKIAVKTSGLHKQRILVNVSEQGIKLIDQRTGVPNYQHAVNRISFISRDSTDSRAFGYVFGDVDGTHKFFAIKTEKAAENLVLTLRDLFQIVYAKKKQEMEEAKKQQQVKVEEEKKAEQEAAEKAKTVITLDKELEQESSTDDEPVYQVIINGEIIEDYDDEPIYAVPTNNTAVKVEEQTAGSNLVDLENELQTLGQGIEQMNQFESLFDSMDTPETGTRTTSPASQTDPWGVNSLEATAPNSSSSGDLADLDLFNAPVQKKKEDIMNLFGPSMPPAGPQGFGAAPFPGAGVNPGFQNAAWPGGAAPGTPFPVAAAPGAPFGGVPMAGGMPGAMPPPVPQRQMGGGMVAPQGGMPVPPANNPFASSPFPSQPGVPPGGTFSAFPNAAPQPAVASDANLLDQPLMPYKVESDTPPENKAPVSSKGAFDDLCNIGAKEKANKAPKDLFADLSAVPKKSIKEMMGQPQAQASDNPFGTLDRNASLPAAFDFTSPFPSTKSSDPFDTSFVDPSKPHLPVAKVFPMTKETPKESLNLTLDNTDEKDDLKSKSDSAFCDSDDFDLPSPDGPPPPLPVEKPEEPPLPKLPPRPSVGSLQENNVKQLPSDNPIIPPRNTVTDTTKTAISPVPRPRPRTNVNKDNSCLPSVPPRPIRNIDSSSDKTSRQNDANSCDTNKMEDVKPVIYDQSNSSNNKTSVHGCRFVIEDPFTTSDPFADTDPFSSSSDGFSSCDFISANDPFISSTFSSQSSTNKNGTLDKSLNDDPFAVFDNSLNDSFNFKNSSRRSSKAGSSSKKNNPNTNDPFGVPFVPNGQEALYATVNKPKN